MISYATYRIIHLFGIFVLFLALGAQTLGAMTDGARLTNGARKLLAITHGVALLVILFGGFGLLARIGIAHGTAWPGWIWLKLGIWLLLGAMLMVLRRVQGLARPLWFLLPILGGIAAYAAIYKPF